MNQNRIDRMVAAATGESLAELRRRGFSLANPWTVIHDPEADHSEIDCDNRFVDWDADQANRQISIRPKRSRRQVA